MTSTDKQSNGGGSGKELVALMVGLALIAGAGTLATYWVRTRGVEAAGERSPAPAAAAEPAKRPTVVASAPTGSDVMHADIYFDFKSARLRADAVRLLQEKAALMERTSAWVVLVQGYADRQGPAEYNRTLARQRAEGVKQFLIELGLPDSSVKVITIGQDGAVCDEAAPECQQLNRRVHLEMRKLTRAAAAPVRAVTAQGNELIVTPKLSDQP